MKKFILGIFICLLSFFLMSHNANAISSGSFKLDTAIGQFQLSLQDGVYDGSKACNENVASGSPLYTKLIHTNWNFSNAGVGNNYIVAFTFFNSANNDSFDGHIPIEIKPYYDSLMWVKEVEIEQVSNSQFVVYMIVEIRAQGNINMKFKSDDWFMLYPNECIGNYGWFTRIYWTGDQDYRTQLQTIINALSGLNGAVPSQESINNINNSINNMNNSINNLNDTIEDRNDEEDQALEDATDNAESSGDDSSEEAESATSGLISIIGGFVSAVTNASPSNCNLDGDIGHLDMGVLDLCAMPVPSFVQVIGSIILILVCIPFVIIMFNRFISLFRSFQG